ncbi:hypothetical protein FHX79_116510 [Streptomyces cavourensis]|uniref:Uncharacterized protein n=1 Tax=Streptomyces cavourensis TaxID=67258 RepID=A0ABY5F8A0_9ACTN|nr:MULTISPECIES: hypothetical protein [Streptomyces]TQO34594.1 hypothetical protein FHX79_116510 [Streptomyces cavourensis]UTR79884.1 hypothetical protein NLU04_16115 [Streptomyces cavourensis]WAE70131.1 hypothetical protein OUQ49_32535 [Streptomyces cavourensis]
MTRVNVSMKALGAAQPHLCAACVTVAPSLNSIIAWKIRAVVHHWG